MKSLYAVSLTNKVPTLLLGIAAAVFAVGQILLNVYYALSVGWDFSADWGAMNAVDLVVNILVILAAIAAAYFAFTRRRRAAAWKLLAAIVLSYALNVTWLILASTQGYSDPSYTLIQLVPLSAAIMFAGLMPIIQLLGMILAGLGFYASVVALVWSFIAGRHPQDDATPAAAAKGSKASTAAKGATAPTAIAAVVFAILSPLAGLIFAYTARADIRRSKGNLGGKNVARIAIILGWIFLALSVVGIIIYVIVIATLARQFL